MVITIAYPQHFQQHLALRWARTQEMCLVTIMFLHLVPVTSVCVQKCRFIKQTLFALFQPQILNTNKPSAVLFFECLGWPSPCIFGQIIAKTSKVQIWSLNSIMWPWPLSYRLIIWGKSVSYFKQHLYLVISKSTKLSEVKSKPGKCEVWQKVNFDL